MIRFGKPSEVGVATHVIVKKLKEKGYTAAGDPTGSKSSSLISQTNKIKEIRRIFEDADIMLAEVGCWANLLDTDHAERQKNRDRMVETLAVADALGARCSVSGLGSYCHGYPNSKHSKKNFSDEAFQEAVGIARYCIDSVQQLKALSSAADEVALIILQNHIEGCVTDAIREQRGEDYIEELIATIRKAMKH